MNPFDETPLLAQKDQQLAIQLVQHTFLTGPRLLLNCTVPETATSCSAFLITSYWNLFGFFALRLVYRLNAQSTSYQIMRFRVAHYQFSPDFKPSLANEPAGHGGFSTFSKKANTNIQHIFE